MFKKSFVILMSLLMMGFIANAQQQETGQNLDYNVISTAVPFMIIAPDARSAGMGDLGVSTSACPRDTRPGSASISGKTSSTSSPANWQKSSSSTATPTTPRPSAPR